ncbi:MAG: formyltransferase family protein [Pseudomonadota bacterium]
MKADFLVTVCASGGGGNFEAVVEAQEAQGYRVNLLIVDRECGAIDKADKHRIPCKQLNRALPTSELLREMDRAIPDDTDLIVLAGFFPIIGAELCRKWAGRMINTHPSLLPRYGGKGMYGVRVQEAVLASGDSMAGCTVHYVDERIDGGEIILQQAVAVNAQETAWELGGRIFIEENRLLVQAIGLIMRKCGEPNV